MLLEVAQQLYAVNLARIYALAEEDYHAVNEPYPPLEEPSFVLGAKLGGMRANAKGSKSVN